MTPQNPPVRLYLRWELNMRAAKKGESFKLRNFDLDWTDFASLDWSL